MGILRTDRVSGLGGANAIKGSAHFHGGGDCGGLETEVSSDFQFGSSNFTIEVWANWSGFDSSGFETIVKSGNTNGSNSMFQFDYKSSESKLRIIPYVSDSSVVKQVSFTPEFDRWYHLAAVRDGNNLKIFIDGTQTGGDLSFSDTIDTETTGLSIGKRAMSDENNGFERNFNGYLSNLRIVNGTAIYTADFTPPTNELEKTSDTVLLALQSPGNLFQEATGKKLYVAADSLNQQSVTASRFTPNSPVGFSTTTDVGTQFGSTFDGVTTFDSQAYMVPPSGNTRERNRGRGIYGLGGFPSYVNSIDFLQIQSTGNAQNFGDLTITKSFMAAAGNQTRSVFSRSFNGAGSNTMDFVTIANTANAIDFGDATTTAHAPAGCGNNTRGLFGGGATTNILEFITFATAGNAQDFGDLYSKRDMGGLSNSTRGVFAGGGDAPQVNTIQFVTISTTGNGSDFGDLTQETQGLTGSSNSTRGIFAGGYTPTVQNTIQFITIATTGDATDFGDLTFTSFRGASCSSPTRSVIMRGFNNSGQDNLIDFITISTTGNAQDFGDKTAASSQMSESGTSDCHGGLS